MSELFFVNVKKVDFGGPLTVRVHGEGVGGEEAVATFQSNSLQTVVPALAKAATAFHQSPAADLPHLHEKEVPEMFVTVLDGNVFPCRDTKEPGLTLHTYAGLLQFHMSPEAAVRIVHQLLELGMASQPPAPKARH